MRITQRGALLEVPFRGQRDGRQFSHFGIPAAYSLNALFPVHRARRAADVLFTRLLDGFQGADLIDGGS